MYEDGWRCGNGSASRIQTVLSRQHQGSLAVQQRGVLRGYGGFKWGETSKVASAERTLIIAMR